MAYGAVKRVGKKSMAKGMAKKAAGKTKGPKAMASKGMGLTKKQKTLPPALQKKIMNSKKKK